MSTHFVCKHKQINKVHTHTYVYIYTLYTCVLRTAGGFDLIELFRCLKQIAAAWMTIMCINLTKVGIRTHRVCLSVGPWNLSPMRQILAASRWVLAESHVQRRSFLTRSQLARGQTGDARNWKGWRRWRGRLVVGQCGDELRIPHVKLRPHFPFCKCFFANLVARMIWSWESELQSEPTKPLISALVWRVEKPSAFGEWGTFKANKFRMIHLLAAQN